MSLILEALKKSEDKRRLGAAPDLATPFSAPRRRSWVWPLAVLIVIACAVGWALRPSTPASPMPAASMAASKANAPTTQTVTTPGQKTGTPLRSVTGNNDLVQTAPPPMPAKSPVRPAGGKFVPGQPDANSPPEPETPRSGREIFEAMRRKAAQAELEKQQAEMSLAKAPTPPPKANPKADVARTAHVAAPPPPAPASVAAAPRVAAPTPAPSTPAQPTVAPTVASSPTKTDDVAATPAPGRAPKSPSTIGLTPPPAAPVASSAKPASNAQPYSELPFSVRKSLPELKLSMHVYTADPSHRFVVLNDSRLTEGEKTTDEIFVREIRPDGVVLEFQSQRFFYPRDGL